MVENDKILLIYENISIRQQELDFLTQNQWLNDNVISFYMQYLVDQIDKNVEKRVIKVIDASVVGFMRELTTSQDLHDMFDSLQLEAATDILLPVNDSKTILGGGTHWSQLHIKCNQQDKSYTAALYNSALASSEVSDQAKIVIERLKVLLNQKQLPMTQPKDFP